MHIGAGNLGLNLLFPPHEKKRMINVPACDILWMDTDLRVRDLWLLTDVTLKNQLVDCDFEFDFSVSDCL